MLEEVALGVVGLSEEAFYKMTPRTFSNVLKGHSHQSRKSLERHRELIVTLMAPHLDKSDRKKTLAELYPLPGEPEYQKYLKEAGKKVDPKEARKLALQRWEKADAKIKKKTP